MTKIESVKEAIKLFQSIAFAQVAKSKDSAKTEKIIQNLYAVVEDLKSQSKQ